MTTCRFKDALGKPGQGFHAPRILGVAALDLLGTALVAWLIARARRGWHPVPVFLVLMALAVVLHRLFCVDTALNVALFGSTRT
jgi:hypothetical protein